jgi:ribosome-associated heat shock protein Hsp15
MRIDKYLWCVRLYKTRSLATEDVRVGKVFFGGQIAKASKEVKPGDVIGIKKHGYELKVRIVELPKGRVGPPLVPRYMEDCTPAEELEKKAFLAMAKNLTRQKGLGRPTKKERRNLDQMFYDDDAS